ncbi:conserved Plasmodium protein, unknown function [Plasmodium sp. gorilla clade G2]|uniref:conserved Plasmodium protein, unknown function n=1 Tax=Plasmodium sp. gorilla clade G2 TaxID=880535 RepID=UPI000D215867|nr:conserved Plasmodium protein, unknown function [Plasmodium sp. gorilla clade G2]SOV12550.1 conserved Plasmodium protein, unknown function [Plasmodium sp. gorilla clade G2]
MITSSIIESFTVHFFLPFLNFVTFFLFFLFFKMEDLFFITSKKKKLVPEEFIETTENEKDNQKDEYFFTVSKNKLIKNKNNLSSIETFSSYMSHTKRCALNTIENEEKEKLFSSHINNVADTYKKTNTETPCSDKITVLINKEKSNNNKNIHSNNNIYYNDNNILYNNDSLLKNNELKEPLKIHQPLSTPIHNEKKNLIYSNNIFYKYYMNNYQEEKNVVHTNNNYNLHSDNNNYANESISNNNTHIISINNMNNINNNSNNVSVSMAKNVLRAWYCDHDNPNEIIDSKNSNIESIKTQNVYETNNNDMNPFFNSTMDFKSNKFIDNKTDKCGDNTSDNKSNINNEEYFQNFITNKNNNLRDTIISDENNKMIIIKKVDDERNMQDDNFSYLHDILEKTYKEYVNCDGSEYIYIYDICVRKDRINNNNDNNDNIDNNNIDNNNNNNIDNIDNNNNIDNIYDDNYYDDENNITSDTHINNNIHNNNINHSENKIIIDNAHKNEYNIFNNISMKINKIKGFFISTNKLTEDQSNISTDILQMTKQIKNDMNNKEMILYNDNYMEEEKLNIHNINETNIQNNKKEIIKHNDIQFEDKKEIIKCVDKTSFIDKLNYIFFTSINNNNNTNNDTTNDNNNNYDNKNNQNNYNNHNNYNNNNNYNNYNSYNFHIKEVSQDYHFEDIKFDNLHNNMNHNINRRIYETDIYDIHIIKKGYNYIYIKDGEWKHFFCVLFYLQNNIGLKNDIICKHYCKIYDRGDYILKKINDNNSSDICTNYFLSFFEDIYFNKHQLNNLELAILIKKKSYEFIFEITKYKTAHIIHNFHYIYIDQDKKTNNCLNIFDVDNNSYYIIPFIFKTTQTYHNKQNIYDEEKQNNEHLINHINFSCDILKHWNESIYFITKKMEATSHANLTNLKQNQNKIRYVNRKLNQWIHVFKQERNIKHL